MARSNSVSIYTKSTYMCSMISDDCSAEQQAQPQQHSMKNIDYKESIPDGKFVQHDSSLNRRIIGGETNKEINVSPTPSFDSTGETSTSSIAVTSSPNEILPGHGKSLLPPVLLKQYTCPIPAECDDGWRIRSRYLHCLGMDEELQHHDHPRRNSIARMTSYPNQLNSSTNHHGQRGCEAALDSFDLLTALRSSQTTSVLLKKDHGLDDDTLLGFSLRGNGATVDSQDHSLHVYPIKNSFAVKSKKAASQNRPSPLPPLSTSRVSFHPAVQVCEIPSHHSYSRRIKETIWMLPQEYVESVTKNAIEFMSEGYEPDRVVDESDFVRRDGRLVHPVCEILEEPENERLKQIYYGIKPKKSKKGAQSSRKIGRAL